MHESEYLFYIVYFVHCLTDLYLETRRSRRHYPKSTFLLAAVVEVLSCYCALYLL